jgi:hypothetical protein
MNELQAPRREGLFVEVTHVWNTRGRSCEVDILQIDTSITTFTLSSWLLPSLLQSHRYCDRQYRERLDLPV